MDVLRYAACLIVLELCFDLFLFVLSVERVQGSDYAMLLHLGHSQVYHLLGQAWLRMCSRVGLFSVWL